MDENKGFWIFVVLYSVILFSVSTYALAFSSKGLAEDLSCSPGDWQCRQTANGSQQRTCVCQDIGQNGECINPHFNEWTSCGSSATGCGPAVCSGCNGQYCIFEDGN